MSQKGQKPSPGAANSSSWNDSGFAFAPNTNTMDKETMPSATAQAARDKSAEIMAALKAGDTQRANALMGKDPTPGRLLPGMTWLKKKINSRGKQQPALVGEEPAHHHHHQQQQQQQYMSDLEKSKEALVK